MTVRHTLLYIPLLFLSCNYKEISPIEVIKFDKRLIDTLVSVSDTSYSTFIGRNDYYTIDFYLTKRDSLITKILKDSLGNVVGV